MDSEDEDLAFNLQLCELSQALCDEDAKRNLSSNALFNSQFKNLVREQELAMNRLAERRRIKEEKRGHEEGKRRQEEERRRLRFEEEEWRRKDEEKRRREEEKTIIEEKKRRQEEQDRQTALELAHRLMREESSKDYCVTSRLESANLGENDKSLSELLKDQELEFKRIALWNQQIKDQNKSPSSTSQHDVLDCHPHGKYGKSKRQNRSRQSPESHSPKVKTELHDSVVTPAYQMSKIVIPDQNLEAKGMPNHQTVIPDHKWSQKGKNERVEMSVRTQNSGADLRHPIGLDLQQQYVPITPPSRLPQHISVPALPKLPERSSILAQEVLLPSSTNFKDPPTMTMPMTPKESLEATAPPYRMSLPPVKCPQCMVHNGLSCIDFQVNFDGGSMEHAWNHCPKCDAHVPWHHGCCNHVACRCGYQFCSICGWEWSSIQINC